ncbi:MAG: hypothetical protein UW81_C0004G0008 [Candidatus Giovannonibacteria bacterium GW2011_GWC2_44_9]|uniref:FCP1 homology domain-containing protein n=3 Tax=Candidatus Giovannoniibacteriota TaxID=1752738 RepID=A0A0G1LX40_9BACT|nr:MAG: hypothetical protein UW49_C0001G0020 [Candidatus Giovannonibacteria bacterium GW2011_GWB1_44_23]KKT64294.1 MAG: hypothetical protein UW57_C0001G0021 [Candidatus Giovannonibacteria bacterium GW2011_GWA1_44_29]KKT84247.1 MAG: hypothetical protein UW81_C0004G0008 [Candidatus Giovannonibacteria bacterium GW2011_GWC2_44_9]KKT92021.1 MAG: hypothetical protein UW93_C0001G0020 [Parcubacteria group bacterium GW2011_GWC1_45_13]
MKKCIVLDLDNTLWGGIIGEDGLDGIKLSLSNPGASFIAFQQALLDLQSNGVILAVNSRNNYDEAMRAIRTHPNMILKELHFAAFRINWADKADNLKEIASEINIGLDSIVFLDDDPANRAMVREFLPEVEVPEMPANPSDYTKFLISLPYFKTTAVTDEDKMRGNYYVTERLRKEAEKSHKTKESFLKDLGMEIYVSENDRSAASRLSQMTKKTNQFNIDKQPFTEEEIIGYILSPNHKIFHAKAADKFGDYGIVIFALANTAGENWHIKSLLMSCRIIGRGVETAFLHAISQKAQRTGAKKITIGFKKSGQNHPAEEFVKKYFNDKMASIDGFTNPPSWINIRLL